MGDVDGYVLLVCDEDGTLPQPNHEKNIRQIKIKEHSTKFLTSIPKIVKAIKNKESLRNHHSQEEHKETGQLNVMWRPGWDSGMEKGHQVINKET